MKMNYKVHIILTKCKNLNDIIDIYVLPVTFSAQATIYFNTSYVNYSSDYYSWFYSSIVIHNQFMIVVNSNIYTWLSCSIYRTYRSYSTFSTGDTIRSFAVSKANRYATPTCKTTFTMKTEYPLWRKISYIFFYLVSSS